jgi:hypothetical protein
MRHLSSPNVGNVQSCGSADWSKPLPPLPLVKLWVGALLSATGFHLSTLRVFADKTGERDFAEKGVYLNNDFHLVQRRSRIAMWTLNGLLLVFLAFAVRGAFGSGVGLGAALFLAIDPTVAAHLHVVMTDLPVSQRPH